jgi:hypothetical protein
MGVVASPPMVDGFYLPVGRLREAGRVSPMSSLTDLAVGANFWVHLQSSAEFIAGSLVGWPP